MFRKWEETASEGGDLQLRYQLTIPARINILGNPADANEGDHATISTAIDTYVDETMTYCGLPAGAGEANNALIQAALAAGALGPKLTGAGCGGSVFALAQPGHEEELVEALRTAATAAGLEDALVWRAHVDRDGLRAGKRQQQGDTPNGTDRFERSGLQATLQNRKRAQIIH